jgi:hypothetical protein
MIYCIWLRLHIINLYWISKLVLRAFTLYIIIIKTNTKQQIITLLNTQVPLASCYFLCLRSKYYTQDTSLNM